MVQSELPTPKSMVDAALVNRMTFRPTRAKMDAQRQLRRWQFDPRDLEPRDICFETSKMKFNAACHRLKNSLVPLLFSSALLLTPQIAWAQDDAAEPETKAAWLLAYCLVGLLIGLSLYGMCRPSLRRKKD